jgi:hypothetical protein
MHSACTTPPEPHRPELVGVLYRGISIPEVPSTPAKRLVVLCSVGVLVLVVVLAIVS